MNSQENSSTTPLAPAPEPSNWEADDDELAVALGGFPQVPRSSSIRRAVGVALVERGHTATSVHRYLVDNVNVGAADKVGAVVTSLLRDIPPAVAPTPTPSTATVKRGCPACDEGWLSTPSGEKKCPACFPYKSPPMFSAKPRVVAREREKPSDVDNAAAALVADLADGFARATS